MPLPGDTSSAADERAFTYLFGNHNLSTHAFLSCSLAAVSIIHGHRDSVIELLVDLNLVTLVARADKINEYLQSAYNGVRFQYAQRELDPPKFDWHYDPKTLMPLAIRIILEDDSMTEILKALSDWQAVSALDHIMMVGLLVLLARRALIKAA